ncbi:hypothetical protein ACNKHM_13390 [Shigella sonnei]
MPCFSQIGSRSLPVHCLPSAALRLPPMMDAVATLSH